MGRDCAKEKKKDEMEPSDWPVLWVGSYDTLYLVDNSNSDVVTYWTMIRTHVVPDRQY